MVPNEWCWGKQSSVQVLHAGRLQCFDFREFAAIHNQDREESWDWIESFVMFLPVCRRANVCFLA